MYKCVHAKVKKKKKIVCINVYNLQFWWLICHNHWNWKFAKAIPQITAFYAKQKSQLQLLVDHNHQNLKFIKSAPQLTPIPMFY